MLFARNQHFILFRQKLLLNTHTMVYDIPSGATSETAPKAPQQYKPAKAKTEHKAQQEQ
jgi:hypothetical protein